MSWWPDELLMATAGTRDRVEADKVRSTIIVNEAERRWLNDPGFHMTVEIAVQRIEHSTGVVLDRHDRSIATLAAAVALTEAGQ